MPLVHMKSLEIIFLMGLRKMFLVSRNDVSGGFRDNAISNKSKDNVFVSWSDDDACKESGDNVFGSLKNNTSAYFEFCSSKEFLIQ